MDQTKQTHFEVYPEISCPYCRIGLGGFKVHEEFKTTGRWWWKKKVLLSRRLQHLDIIWTSESGLIKDCKNNDYMMQQVRSVDGMGNPKFSFEVKIKLDDLETRFLKCPDDITNVNFDLDDFKLAFINCIKYGQVFDEETQYIEPKMTYADITDCYKAGMSLDQTIKKFILPL